MDGTNNNLDEVPYDELGAEPPLKKKPQALIQEEMDEDEAKNLLAMEALQNEELRKQEDADAAIALSLMLNEEELRQQQHAATSGVVSAPPPLPENERHKNIKPAPPPSVDPIASAKSMFDKIVNTVSTSVTSVWNSTAAAVSGDDEEEGVEEREKRRKKVEQYRRRRDRQLVTVLNVMEIEVPAFAEGDNEEEVTLQVKTLDGRKSEDDLVIKINRKHFQVGDRILLPFDGEPIKYLPVTAAAQKQDALIAFYNRHNPREVEVDIPVLPFFPNSRKLGGCELIDCLEGVFIKSALIPLSSGEPDRRDYQAGDLVVAVEGHAVVEAREVRELLEGKDCVRVRVLRRERKFVKCPALHLVEKDISTEVKECDLCGNDWARFACSICAYDICCLCHDGMYEKSKVKSMEGLSKQKLAFGLEDLGKLVLVFDWGKGVWKRGEIFDFDDVFGHTIKFEEEMVKQNLEGNDDYFIVQLSNDDNSHAEMMTTPPPQQQNEVVLISEEEALLLNELREMTKS